MNNPCILQQFQNILRDQRFDTLDSGIDVGQEINVGP